MARYKLLPGDTKGVFDTVYGIGIPEDPGFLPWRIYQEWLFQGGVPDPAFSQAELDAQAADQAKQQQIVTDLATNLPTWAQVQTSINNITNLADAKAFLLKLARVVYIHIKNDTV